MIPLLNSFSVREVEVDNAIGETSILESLSIREQEVDNAIGDTSILESLSIREQEINPREPGAIIESLSVSPNTYDIFGEQEQNDIDFNAHIIRVE